MLRGSQTRFWSIVGLVFLGGIYLLAPVLTPFLFSALLAYLGDPLIDWLETHKISRSWAVTLVFGALLLLVLVLLLLLIPLSTHQFKALMQRLPTYVDWFQASILPWLRDTLGLDPEMFDLGYLRTQLTAYTQEIGHLASGLMESFRASSTAVFNWLANLVLVPVVTFYFLRDWDGLVAKLHDLVPRRIEATVSRLAQQSDEVIGAFLRGQFIVMGALGIIYSAGLAIVGLEFSLLIGLLAGLVSFVPYLGLIVGIAVASIAAVLQFQNYLSIVPVLVVFGVGQLISDFILTPRLVGDRIGLHPVAVLFAVLAGGHLFGFFGILLALPIAAVIAVVLRHVHDEYLQSIFYRQ
ncbi:MAG: AI-2E family transporter [Candidatus Competibacteraceae bacterium]|nr:AI-2E family transporter [Candidatus Competibacteraceae bacterium]MBK8898106.1 AI-2E family transporter [Candidatus Competibacteraceae bacterium]MBK8961912.1 AI-2E family transporter [Candidatus Competibacteraceae bacterium]MBK9951128.1 AI-2E family transporter [Candidatus Competibacteraceae bacterium]